MVSLQFMKEVDASKAKKNCRFFFSMTRRKFTRIFGNTLIKQFSIFCVHIRVQKPYPGLSITYYQGEIQIYHDTKARSD